MRSLTGEEKFVIGAIVIILLCLVCGLSCSHVYKNTCKPMEVTNYKSMRSVDYPDTVRVLTESLEEEQRVIGKFTNLGYKIHMLRVVLRETWKDNWKEERYLVFVKVKK
jgi:hypothetical protein